MYNLYLPIVSILLSLFIVRLYDSSIILIPFAISFINLVMYHTIENPDVKMIQD